MPSLSLLKRPGREASPWSMRTWNDPSDNIDESSETTTTRTESMPIPARNGMASIDNDNGFGSTAGGYGNSGADVHGVATSASFPATSPLSPTKKDRRDSKRDLFHGLISRSIRGAGRALSTASSPPSPSSSQSASTTSLSASSSSLISPTSTAATTPNATSLFAPPSQTSSPSPFRARNQTTSTTAAPAPQRLLRSRPRQSSAAPAYSGAPASSKTVRAVLSLFLFCLATLLFIHLFFSSRLFSVPFPFPSLLPCTGHPACHCLLAPSLKKKSFVVAGDTFPISAYCFFFLSPFPFAQRTGKNACSLFHSHFLFFPYFGGAQPARASAGSREKRK